MNEPKVGIPVKLKKGQLLLSARQIQYVKEIRKLSLENQRDHDNGIHTKADLDGEGGYWIKTDRTAGEWWAWSLFRVA